MESESLTRKISFGQRSSREGRGLIYVVFYIHGFSRRDYLFCNGEVKGLWAGLLSVTLNMILDC